MLWSRGSLVLCRFNLAYKALLGMIWVQPKLDKRIATANPQGVRENIYSLEDDEVPLCELAVNEAGKENASLATQCEGEHPRRSAPPEQVKMEPNDLP